MANRIVNAEKTLPTMSLLAKAALVGSALTAGLVGADVLGGNLRWTGTKTTVRFVDDAHNVGKRERLWVALPGLGIRSSRHIAQALQPVLDGPAAYVELPQQRQSLHEIAARVNEFVQRHNISRLGFYGQSMGGIVIAHLLPKLHTPVDRIMLDCSPTSIEDARAGSGAARIVDRLGYKGGVLTKAIGAIATFRQTSEQAGPPGVRDYANAIWRGLGPDSTSPMLWTWQMGLLCRSQPEQLGHLVSNHLAQDGAIAYFMPSDPKRDPVVDVETAYHNWNLHSAIPVKPLPIAGATHAYPVAHMDGYGTAIDKWLQLAA